MEEITKPRSDHAGGHFLFVSYSHDDKELVYKDIQTLQAKEMRIWYDEGLEPGEEWFRDVESKVNMPECIGVIFYVSQTFLSSSSVQREITIFSESTKKNYYPVNLLNASIPEQVMKTPGISPALQSELCRLFRDDVTYMCSDDAERTDKMVNTFTKWGFDQSAVFFPCKNVLHYGRPEYLPALLDLTPLNYTFFATGDKLRWIAETLNQVCRIRTRWQEFRAHTYLQDGAVPPDCDGLVVVFSEEETYLLRNVLEKRAKTAAKLPLLAVFYRKDPSAGLPAEILSEIDSWRRHDPGRGPLSGNAAARLQEYLLTQTDFRKQRLTQEEMKEKLENEEITERWRTLLSDGSYHTLAVETAKKRGLAAACGRWLLYQEPLWNETRFNEDILRICPDPCVLEMCSREKFRRAEETPY